MSTFTQEYRCPLSECPPSSLLTLFLSLFSASVLFSTCIFSHTQDGTYLHKRVCEKLAPLWSRSLFPHAPLWIPSHRTASSSCTCPLRSRHRFKQTLVALIVAPALHPCSYLTHRTAAPSCSRPLRSRGAACCQGTAHHEPIQGAASLLPSDAQTSQTSCFCHSQAPKRFLSHNRIAPPSRTRL